MKKLILLAVVASFVLGAAMANAAEIKVTNDFKTAGVISTDTAGNFGKHTESNDAFNIYSRLRTEWSFTPANNDKINIYMRTEVAANSDTNAWGRGAFGLGGSSALQVNRLYLDFFWPGTNINFRAGLQPIALWNSSVVGASSAILDDNVAAFQMTAPIIEDTFAIAVGYARAVDLFEDDPDANATYGGHSVSDELDLGYIGFPLTFEGINVSPFFVLGFAGNSSGMYASPTKKDWNPWWAGVAFDFTMLEDFGFGLDFNYGCSDPDEEIVRSKGWIVDFAAQYTGLDFMTPKILFAYGSGEDDDAANGSERMPIISSGWAGMTDNLADASDLIGVNDFNITPDDGVWGIEIGLLDINFIEKLSNDVKFGYWRGTNHKDSVARCDASDDGFNLQNGNLTTEDYAFEIDLDTKYQLYEELYLVLELGYSYLNADRDTWAGVANVDNLRNNWRGGLGVRAQF